MTVTLPAPGVVGTIYAGTPAHEARHLAAAVLLGLDVIEARADCPDPETAGYVRVQGGLAFPREFALMCLVGAMDEEDWPPAWPPSENGSPTCDERNLAKAVNRLGLDEAGYRRLYIEALDLAASEDFYRLENAYGVAMQTGWVLTPQDVSHIKAITENNMEHKVKAAAATITDLGEFEAIAACWTEDRERDVIVRGAFAGTVARWRASAKRIPLHWEHRPGAEAVIGDVDPMQMRETDEGLHVAGRLDLEDSDLAREAWRSVKAGRIGLSFGYLAKRSRNRKGGGRELLDLDVYEISLTPAPMHADTRILSYKGGRPLQLASFEA